MPFAGIRQLMAWWERAGKPWSMDYATAEYIAMVWREETERFGGIITYVHARF